MADERADQRADEKADERTSEVEAPETDRDEATGATRTDGIRNDASPGDAAVGGPAPNPDAPADGTPTVVTASPAAPAPEPALAAAHRFDPVVPGPVGGSYVPFDDVISTAEPAAATAGPRPRPDALLLVVGVLTALAALATFLGVTLDLTGFDPRWLFAGGAAAIGALLLASGLRGRRRAA